MEKMGMLIRTFTAPYLYHRGLISIRCFVVEALKEITEYPEITIRPSWPALSYTEFGNMEIFRDEVKDIGIRMIIELKSADEHSFIGKPDSSQEGIIIDIRVKNSLEFN